MNDLERADLPSFLPHFFVVEVHATTEKEVGARFSPLSLFFNRVVALAGTRAAKVKWVFSLPS